MLVSAEPGAEPGYSAEETSARLAEKRAAVAQLPAEDYPYIREMAADLFGCDDPEGFYDFNVHLFVSGARATLAELQAGGRRTAQSSA
jgi:hypothetical protein